jgi:hypothetical protein
MTETYFQRLEPLQNFAAELVASEANGCRIISDEVG